jgi:hypothetical protein
MKTKTIRNADRTVHVYGFINESWVLIRVIC